jgi:hypothetical protein
MKEILYFGPSPVLIVVDAMMDPRRSRRRIRADVMAMRADVLSKRLVTIHLLPHDVA